MHPIITDRLLVSSLRSSVCPACGGRKDRGKTLCLADYRRLPKTMRNALYARVGEGYGAAVAEAMTFLEATSFCLPPDVDRKG